MPASAADLGGDAVNDIKYRFDTAGQNAGSNGDPTPKIKSG
jgi:hypothetical protein